MSDNKPMEISPGRQRYLKWRGRFGRILIIVGVVLVCLRILLALLLPYTLNKAASYYGMDCTYSRLRLAVMGGYASVWDLKLSPEGGGQPIATIAHAGGDISMLDLLRARLSIWRLEANGLDINIERKADGTIPLLERLAQSSQKSQQVKQQKVTQGGLDFSSPLSVESVGLSSLRLHLRDERVKPSFAGTMELSLEVTHLGAAGRAAVFALSLHSAGAPSMLDELRIAGTARGEGRWLSLNARLKAWGIKPAVATAYLQALGVRPAAESLELDGEMNLLTQPVDVAPDAMRVHLGMSRLRLGVDRESAMALREFTLDAPRVSPRRLDLGRIVIDGVDVAVARTREGLLRAAGFDLLAAAAPGTRPAASAAAAAAPATEPASARAASTQPIFPASLDELLIRNVNARFRDEAAGTQLELRLEELRGSNWATYPRHAQRPAELQVTFGLPGIARRATLSMAADPFARTKSGKVQLEMTGLKLDAIAPYLSAAGLTSEFKNGALRAELEGSFQQQTSGWLKGDVRLKDLSLLDGGELLRWDNAGIRGLAIDPRTLEVNADAIELVGPKLRAQRDAAGAIHVLGLRTAGPAPAPAPLTPAAKQPAPATEEAVLPIPRLTIGKFSWTGISAQLVDSAVTPAATLEISDAGMIIEKIAFERGAAARPREPAQIRAWLCAPGLADRLELGGQLSATLRQAKLDLKVQGKGLTLAGLAPYTAPLGVWPALKDGALRASLQAAFEKMPGGHGRGSLSISDVALLEGKDELAGLGSLVAPMLETGASGLHLGEITVQSPRIHITRQASGDLALLGAQLGQSAAKPKAAAATEPLAATTAPAPAPAPAAGLAAAPPFIVTLDRLHVENAKAQWTDFSVQPTVDWHVTTQLNAEQVCVGQDAPPAKLRIESAIQGVLQQFVLDGTIRTGLRTQGADVSLNMQGLSGGTFNSYLPPTLRASLTNASSSLKLVAEHRMVPGADEVSAEVRQFSLRDGQTLLASFASAGAQGVRLTEDIHAASLFLRGATLRLQRTSDGEISLLGLQTQSKPVPPLSEAAPAAATPTAPVHADADVLALVSAARKAAPLVQLDHLEVGVDEVRFHDAARPSARDLVIRNMTLSNEGKPIRLLGKDPASQPPADLRLGFAVEDLAEQGEVRLSALPFASTPSLKLTFNATGIHGDKLAEFVPELEGRVDGAPLQAASAHLELDLSAKIERRGPAAFDFRRDFSLYATLSNLRFDLPGQPTLLGVEAIAFPEIQVRPASADVIIPSIEVTRPIAHIYKEKDGLHVAGVRLLLPAAGGSATRPQTVAPPQATAAPASASPPSPAPATATGEVLVQKLTISGIDVSYEDRSVEPAVVVPLTGLEFEVAGLSSKAAVANRPIRFSGLLYAGKELLPQRKGPPTTRPVFTQFSTSGQLTLYPQPQGWAKTSLTGFELVAIAPLAKPYGVDISGGLNDVDADLRIRSRTEADVTARVLVNDLSLSETDNGPIFRTLHLPAPTSTIIGLMEDADGSITLHLAIPVREGTVSVSSITASALAATSQVIATAVASAPMKLVSGLTGGGNKKVKRETRLELHFAPGDSELRAADRMVLAQALESYRFDRQAEITIAHQLGKSDISLAGERVNPEEEDAAALVNQLRANRRRLLDRKNELEARARAELAMYSALSSRRAVADVQAACRDLSQTEDALDRVLELFRPGAAGQADRRTRAAAIELGERRLSSVENTIGAAHVSTLASRVTKTPGRFAVPEDGKDGVVVVTITSRAR